METRHLVSTTAFARTLVALLFLAPFMLSAATVNWNGGGDGANWSDPLNWSGDALPGAADDVVIDVPASAVWITNASGNITVRSVICAESLAITGGSFKVTAGTSRIEGGLHLNAGRSLEANGTNAVFEAVGPATFNGAYLYANNRGRIALSNAPAYSDTSGCCGSVWQATSGGIIELPALAVLTGNPTWAQLIRAYSGGRISLPALTTISNSQLSVLAEGTNSLVDLPALSDFQGTGGFLPIEARAAGQVLIPQLAEASRVGLTLRTGGFIPTAQITNLTRGSIYLDSGYALNLPGIVTADGASLEVVSGSSLTMSGLRTYTDNSGCCGSQFQATGGATLSFPNLTNLTGNPTWAQTIRAWSGAAVHLPVLTTINPSAVAFLADGSNSLVNLPLLLSFSLGGGSLSFEARNLGTIFIPLLQDASRFAITVRTGGQIPVTQITNISRGSIYLDGTNALPITNIVSMDGASIELVNGASLTLPLVGAYADTSGCCGALWQVSGGGTLSLPGLTNLTGNPTWVQNIRAYGGSTIRLGALTTISPSVLKFVADGTNAWIDLPLLSDFLSTSGFIWFEASTSGRISIPVLDDGTRVSFTLRSRGNISIAQVTNLTLGSITLDGGYASNLVNLLTMDGATLTALGGASLGLPSVRSYIDTAGCCGVTWEANGAGSSLSLPQLTSFTPNKTWADVIRALAGAAISFDALPAIDDGHVNFLADGTGSAIDLGGLRENTSTGRRLGLESRNGGGITLNAVSTELPFTTVTLGTNSTLTAGLIDLGAGSAFQGAGTLSASLINRGSVTVGASPGALRILGNYTQTDEGSLVLEVAGTTPGTGFDQLNVTGLASLAGRLQAGATNSFAAVNAQSFPVINAAAVSGQFDTLANMFAGPSLEFTPVYGPTNVSLVAGFSTGPSVVTSSPSGNATNRLTQFTLVFSELISTGSFTTADITLTGPAGAIPVSAPAHVSGATWQIDFAEQLAQGSYTLRVGPSVTDYAGNPMTQDGDTVNGEAGDYFETTVVLQDNEGPLVSAVTPIGVTRSNVSALRITFNEPVDAASFTVADVGIVGPGGSLSSASFTLTASNATTFNLTIPLQTNDGAYLVTIGPVINDVLGRPMAAAFNTSFIIDHVGPRVTAMSPSGSVTQAVSSVDLTFDAAINAATFTTSDVTLTGPAGAVTINAVQALSSNVFRVHFPAQNQGGVYTLKAGPTISDVAGNTMDQNQNGLQGEAGNDVFTGTFTIALPDLLVTQVTAPPVVLAPGQTVSISWTVTNAGVLPAAAFSDAVYLSGDTNIGGDTLLAVFASTNGLAAGAAISRTQQVVIPFTGPAGNARFIVLADALQTVDELVETNNAGVVASDTVIPTLLTLQLAATNAVEGSAPVSAQVSRNGSTVAALSVALASSDPTEAGVPATVTIAAGQSSASFTITTLLDGLVDGPQPARVIATASGFASATNLLTVLDADTPQLSLVFSNSTAFEGGTAGARVSRPVATPDALVVTLSSSNPNELVPPTTVTIPVNQTSAGFLCDIANDTLIQSPHLLGLVAEASGHLSASAGLTILDNDTPELTLAVSASVVNEGGGAAVAIGTVTRSFLATVDLAVSLASSDPGELIVPATVVIPAGQPSATFALSAVDDALLDGLQPVVISAFVTETLSGQPIAPGVSTNLIVADNDGPTLTLVIARDAVAEGLSPATTATVSRNTPATNALTVTLTSSDLTEATVPVSVTIPNGAPSAVFNLASLDDATSDGSQSVTITASAAGFNSGSDVVVVTDVNLPDLVVTSVTAPTNAATDSYFNVTYREMNLGLTSATGAWSQVVFLSRDPYPGGDELLGTFTFSGALPPGQYFERTVQTRLPRDTGDYWIVVTSDPTNSVAEVLEDNNTVVSVTPLHVTAEYTATAQTSIEAALAGSLVPITGLAVYAGTVTPAPYKLVNLHLAVRGTVRVISALTDANGNFAATFTPLPGEAGTYTLGAAHPGETSAPVQDGFILLGAKFDPASLRVNLPGLGAAAGAVNLVNLGDVPLTGVSLSVIGANPALSVNTSIAATLPAAGSVPLNYNFAALVDSNLVDALTLRVTTSEGVSVDLPVTVTVEPLRPRLVATPGNLVAGMLRGAQTVVNFGVANLGAMPSGPLNILLPATPFLSLASPAALPSLAPGESNTISLLLTPAADLALTAHDGSLVVQGDGAAVNVPFSFRALSDGRGALRVEAVDEYTYYAAGAPRVAGATITVRDALSRVVITNGVTATNGLVLFTDLAEGYYDVEAEATDHLFTRETVFLTAGTTNDAQVFLSREVVKFIWTVTPTQIEDRTRITLETVFETFVPVPVVTVEPNLIDLAELTNETTQIDLKITNHGLIAANELRLNFSDTVVWKFEPLLRELGDLPARSSLTIPLIIRKLGGSGGLSAAGLRAASGGGCPSASATWQLLCGGRNNGYGTPIGLQNGGGGCGAIGSGGGGGGTAGPGYVPRFYGEANGNCDPCPLLRLGAMYMCMLDLAAPPWISCPKNSLECYQNATSIANGAYPCAKAALACTEMGLAAAGVTAPAAAALEALNKGLDIFDCIRNISGACNGVNSGGGGSGSGGGGGSGNGSSGGLAAAGMPQPAPSANYLGQDTLELYAERVAAMTAPYVYILGSDIWLRSEPYTNTAAWLGQFWTYSEPGSDSAERLSATEVAALLALPIPPALTTNDTFAFIDRWNRTIDYGSNGVRNLADVPVGESTNFIATDVFGLLLTNATLAVEANEAEGFTNMMDGMSWALNKVIADYELMFRTYAPAAGGLRAASGGGGGVCARVKLQLNQDAVMARDAFEAALEIINNQAESLDNVRVDLDIRSASGSTANDLFAVQAPTLSGLSGVDGTGSVGSVATASAKWLLIPTRDAAASTPIQYTVGGAITYDQGGVRVVVPLSPVPITVYPVPNLLVDYFWQRDVISDDPFTEDIEPTVPFTLGVMVRNTGSGAAKNFRVVSSQPQIIENEKGLLIDFEIIATEVAGRNIVPSLTAEFGDIAPGGLGIARWLMTSTLQGLFIDYSATFEHVDGLGDPRLSLIEDVNIHELIRDVRAGGAFEDGRPDFLANDFNDTDVLPDRLYLSNGSNAPVAAVTTATAGTVSTGNLQITLTAPMTPGWCYLRVPEPSDGRFKLKRVLRSDGGEIAFGTNVWTTDRTFVGNGLRPVKENRLHLLDYNSTGSYTLVYEPVAALDFTPPSSAVASLSANSYAQFSVQWSGSDNAGSNAVAWFDIYVSTNSGPYAKWLNRTTQRGALFTGALGQSYAFYSVAADLAGNLEPAPGSADALTSVTQTNRVPVLASPALLVVNEGTTVTVTNAANDPDQPLQTLTFGFGAEAPPGATIHPATGLITWPTGEGNGPGTNQFVVIVADNGLPVLSATSVVSVVVNEVNSAPTMAALTNRAVNEGTLLQFAVTASDADVPANSLFYSLGAGAPAGANINPLTGLFSWTPTVLQGPSTNVLALIVTDNGTPPLSVTQFVTIVVRDFQGDFVVSLGSTNLLGGESSFIPIELTADDLGSLSLVVPAAEGGLTNFVLQTVAPDLLSSSLTVGASNALLLQFQFDPANLINGWRSLANLAFTARTNGPSAIVPLTPEELLGQRTSGLLLTNGLGFGGAVIVVRGEPVLRARHQPAQQLLLYGRPGATYAVEHSTNVTASSPWPIFQLRVQTNRLEILDGVNPLDSQHFYRARQTAPAP